MEKSSEHLLLFVYVFVDMAEFGCGGCFVDFLCRPFEGIGFCEIEASETGGGFGVG